MMHLAILAIVSSLILSTTSSSLTLWQKRSFETLPIYYKCGTFIFLENSIKSSVYRNTWEGNYNAYPFQGLLYDHNLNYRTINVARSLIEPYERPSERPGAIKHVRHKFQIVIDQLNHIVDIVAEMKDGHFIKCKRVDESIPEPPRIEIKEASYQCGHELFTHETIELSKADAMKRMNKRTKYPAPYKGSLYGPELGYHIYPVLRGNKIHQMRRFPETTYCIVISPSSEVVDVIAELSGGDYMKCTRSAVTPNNSLKNDIRVGYLCGVEFFDVNDLKRTAELAKQKKVSTKPRTFPQVYSDAPFYTAHWIYPVMPDGRFYVKGNRRPKYFLVMNLSFEIILVAMRAPQGLEPCEESLRGLGAAPEESDNFICNSNYFENEHIMATVENGCQALGTQNKRYPAKYNGPKFNIPGPYFTWPLIYGAMFKKFPGNLRVVMNSECQLAGVIENWQGVFRKCRRKKDNSVPGGESRIEIFETPIVTVKSLRHGSESFRKQSQNSVNVRQMNSNEPCIPAPTSDNQATNFV